MSDGVRKVWVLDADLADRIAAYQEAEGIVSEVEAARRLLLHALQMRDTLADILNSLQARWTYQKDLRALARDTLVSHPLVAEIHFSDAAIRFRMRDGPTGKIDAAGAICAGAAGRESS